MLKSKPQLLMAVVMLAVPLLHAQLTVTNELDYSSGKYGQSMETDITTYDVAFEYACRNLSGKLVVPPFEQISGPGGVLPRLGRIRRRLRPVVVTRQTRSGFGDIDLSGSYDAFHDEKSGWDISLTGEVKFGTASASKGLGTGKDDYSPHIDISRSIGQYTPWISLGYWFVGKPDGSDLRDYAYGSIGVSYDFTDDTSLSLGFDCSQRSSHSTNVDNDASLELSQKLDATWSIDFLAVAGLSQAAPDFEANGSISCNF